MSGGKLVEAQQTFRSVLQTLLLVVLSSDEEAKLVNNFIFIVDLFMKNIDCASTVARHCYHCQRISAGSDP